MYLGSSVVRRGCAKACLKSSTSSRRGLGEDEERLKKTRFAVSQIAGAKESGRGGRLDDEEELSEYGMRSPRGVNRDLGVNDEGSEVGFILRITSIGTSRRLEVRASARVVQIGVIAPEVMRSLSSS